MYSMRSTPLTCCSIGSAIVSITVCALAPGYLAVTDTVGGTTLGYCDTGRRNSATAPISTKTIANTLARTGCSMKNFDIIGDVLSANGGQLRVHFGPWRRAPQLADHHAVVRLEPA